MSIQQALNQSLLSMAGSAYMTNQILEQGKQSAINEFQAASDDSLKKTQDVVNEFPNYLQNIQEGDSSEEAMKKVVNSVRGQEATISRNRFNRASKQLKKWAPNEADDYTKLAKRKLDDLKQDVMNQILNYDLPDVNNARAEAKALSSQQRQQETYTNQNEAMKERIDILSGTYKSRMHQPSVRMEE